MVYIRIIRQRHTRFLRKFQYIGASAANNYRRVHDLIKRRVRVSTTDDDDDDNGDDDDDEDNNAKPLGWSARPRRRSKEEPRTTAPRLQIATNTRALLAQLLTTAAPRHTQHTVHTARRGPV